MKKKSSVKKKNLTVTVSLPIEYQEMLKTIMIGNYTESKSAMLKRLIRIEYEKNRGSLKEKENKEG